jgi:glycosyltransferase involved in cell wall biosynthesis
LIEGLGPGGAERLLYTNLKYLDGSRFRSTVLTVFPHANHWTEPIRRLGVPVLSLDCRDYRDLPAGAARLRAWLRQERPDLLHTHLWAANVVGRVAGRLSGTRVISSVHNPDHQPEFWNDGADVSLWKRLAALALDRWTACFGCTRMVAVSEYLRQSTHRRLRFPLERTELIYNPVDTEELQSPSRRGRVELLRELGLPVDSLVLLTVGRVSPQKGLIYAIRALPVIRRSYPTAHLLSVGGAADAAWLARVKAEVSALGLTGWVHLLGARRDIPDLLQCCDLFVFPSLYEGMGIALAEAMAAGRAVVASGTGPIPELVRHGVDGWLVPPADPESLAEGICALLADPDRREALGRSAAAATLARFSPTVAAGRLAELYGTVAQQRQRRSSDSPRRGP